MWGRVKARGKKAQNAKQVALACSAEEVQDFRAGKSTQNKLPPRETPNSV